MNKPGFVTVRGAREHNLKNVSPEIPRDALVVFTGVSGSGESSLDAQVSKNKESTTAIYLPVFLGNRKTQ